MSGAIARQTSRPGEYIGFIFVAVIFSFVFNISDLNKGEAV
tara:strand:- start:1791 stop:1913 length:123 start_codon:yes stop_codon:yes gene_type:complete